MTHWGSRGRNFYRFGALGIFSHYVLEGEFEFVCGEDRVTGGPGTFVYATRGFPGVWGAVERKKHFKLS